MADQDTDKVADVQVEEKEDGSKEAVVTTEEGETGSGSSSGGILSEPSSQEAIDEAADDAQS